MQKKVNHNKTYVIILICSNKISIMLMKNIALVGGSMKQLSHSMLDIQLDKLELKKEEIRLKKKTLKVQKKILVELRRIRFEQNSANSGNI